MTRKLVHLLLGSLLCAAVVVTSGCGWLHNAFFVYKLDIEQGNIIDWSKVDALELGMTKVQVAYLMGSPVMENAFARERWDYVESFQPARGKAKQSQVILTFKNERLASIERGEQVDTRASLIRLPSVA